MFDNHAKNARSGYISYRYTRRSVVSSGGVTHVQAQDARYENGRLETEAFSGTLKGDAGLRLVQEMERRMRRRMEGFFDPMDRLLPK